VRQGVAERAGRGRRWEAVRPAEGGGSPELGKKKGREATRGGEEEGQRRWFFLLLGSTGSTSPSPPVQID
jgi:hypothetical protein